MGIGNGVAGKAGVPYHFVEQLKQINLSWCIQLYLHLAYDVSLQTECYKQTEKVIGL